MFRKLDIYKCSDVYVPLFYSNEMLFLYFYMKQSKIKLPFNPITYQVYCEFHEVDSCSFLYEIYRPFCQGCRRLSLLSYGRLILSSFHSQLVEFKRVVHNFATEWFCNRVNDFNGNLLSTFLLETDFIYQV